MRSHTKRYDSLSNVVRLYRDYYGEPPSKIVSVPGRLDFLNTHQDYKGLPVVSVGVNLRCFTAIARSGGKNIVVSFNLMNAGKQYYDEFSMENLITTKRVFSSYLKAAVKVLLDNGYTIGSFKAGIYSDIPIGAGMASSAALTTSFIGAINSLFDLGLSRKDIAEYAYRAEHDILGIPCGRLDQYGCVYGGISLINTRPPYNVESLPGLNGVFIVLDSGVRHRTADIHPRRQEEIEAGLKSLLSLSLPEDLKSKLGYRYWEPKWDSLELEELMPYLSKIPEVPRKRILFTIKMHQSTVTALNILKKNYVEEKFLNEILDAVKRFLGRNIRIRGGSREELVGLVMTYQHILLKDLYDVSLPILDDLVREAVNTGAYGAKLSGAGLGGVVVALAKDYNVAKNIAKKTVATGAKHAWIVEVDEGIREEYKG